jgi:ribonuclease HI
VVVDSLLVVLSDRQIKVVGYADDIVLMVSGIDHGTVCGRMQNGLDVVQQWCEGVGLSVNPAKSEAILFTNRKKIEENRTLTIFGAEVNVSKKVKYLGVILDSKLSWKDHIDHKISKATMAFWQCRRIMGSTWGITPKTARWLYCAVIRPAIVYGCIVWWTRTNTKSCVRALEKVQRLACACTTGCFKTTPTAALSVLLDIPPLQTFVQAEAMSACYRLDRGGIWRGKRDFGHISIERMLHNKIPASKLPGDQIVKRYDFKRNYLVTFPSRADWKLNPNLLNDGKRYFTDGSKIRTRSGCGIFDEERNTGYSFPLGRDISVFQAEVMAILECAVLISNGDNTAHENIAICSDSKAALQALQGAEVTSAIVAECKQKLESITANNRVTLAWVPGHEGVLGNERADAQARRGSLGKPIGPQPTLGIPKACVKQGITKWMRSEHTRLWESVQGCRQAKLVLDKPKASTAKVMSNLSRKDARLACGLVTGHWHVNEHLFRMGLSQTPICRGCGVDNESIFHIVANCPALNRLRQTHMGQAFLTENDCRDVPLRDMLRFAKATGWFTE